MKAPNTQLTIDHNDPNSISWTPEELQKLHEAGFIPQELFEPPRFKELEDYLRINNENLREHCHPNFDKFPFMARIPPQNEWQNAPDLQIIDRRTGQVVQVLEMGGYFQLCEGVILKIKAKELQEWEKETANVKNLNKEQYKTFKDALESYPSDKPLTRKEIVTLIEEIRKQQKNKTFRQSRELIDNKLDCKQEEQLTLFDIIDKKEIKQEKQEMPIIKGLDLDQAEDRIVHTLTLLLSRKSENKDQKSDNYYMGNYEKGVITVHNTEMETARIIISPHELYSTYYGKDNYGSDQITFLLNKLDSLSKKLFSTTWNIQIKSKGNQKRYDKVRTNLPLFQIAILNQDLSESESQEIDNNKSLLEGKKCHFLFKFQPQFTYNIRERYVEFPEDIYLRITEAAGKDRYGQCVNLMRDFLFREKQAKRYELIRNKETLIDILKLNKFWKEGRKKKVNEMINDCFEIFLKIGLLKGWEKVLGTLGQDQFRIQISRDFK